MQLSWNLWPILLPSLCSDPVNQRVVALLMGEVVDGEESSISPTLLFALSSLKLGVIQTAILHPIVMSASFNILILILPMWAGN